MNTKKPYTLVLSVLTVLVSLQISAAESKKQMRIYEYRTAPPAIDPLAEPESQEARQKTLLWQTEPGNHFVWDHAAPPANVPTGPWLGVHVTEVHPLVSSQLGLTEGMGLAVEHVVHESPAHKAGIKKHDILTKIGDQTLVNANQLQVLVRSKKPGKEVSLTYIRKGKKHVTKARIKTRHQNRSARFEGFPTSENMEVIIENDVPIQIEKQVIPKLDPLEKNAINDVIIKRKPGYMDKGVRTSVVLLDNRKLVLSDDTGTYNLTTGNGTKNLIVLNPEGNTIFKGELKDDDAFKKLPEHVRKKVTDMLEKSNAEHVLRFYDDGSNKVRVLNHSKKRINRDETSEDVGVIVEELDIDSEEITLEDSDIVEDNSDIEIIPGEDSEETDGGI